MTGITILDGPVGTELLRRGVPTPLPLWSAQALVDAPDVLAQIHRDYANAGATVHTANTFRTKRRQVGDTWGELTDIAVRIARDSVPSDHRIAGSISPLEDCYTPDLSPPSDVARAEHREMAQRLAGAGVDILLCETFPNVDEALIAVEEAVAQGVETWVSFTAGPEADLLTPGQVAAGAQQAVERGAHAVLVNCVPTGPMDAYVSALTASPLGIPIGCYANAGHVDEKMGWASESDSSGAPKRYADCAERWINAGATIIGCCCGTGPGHIAEVSRRFGGRE